MTVEGTGACIDFFTLAESWSHTSTMLLFSCLSTHDFQFVGSYVPCAESSYHKKSFHFQVNQQNLSSLALVQLQDQVKYGLCIQHFSISPLTWIRPLCLKFLVDGRRLRVQIMVEIGAGWPMAHDAAQNLRMCFGISQMWCIRHMKRTHSCWSGPMEAKRLTKSLLSERLVF